LILLHFAPLGGWNLAKTLGTHQKSIKKHKQNQKNNIKKIILYKIYDFYDLHLVSCQNLPKLAKTPGIPSFCLVKA